MQKSIDFAEEKGIINPRLFDWNIVATEWKYDNKKDCFVSIEYKFMDDLKWKKYTVTKKTIYEETDDLPDIENEISN